MVLQLTWLGLCTHVWDLWYATAAFLSPWPVLERLNTSKKVVVAGRKSEDPVGIGVRWSRDCISLMLFLYTFLLTAQTEGNEDALQFSFLPF